MSLRRSRRVASNPVERIQLGNATRKLRITTKSMMDMASIPDAAAISRPWTDCRANTLAQTYGEMLSIGSPSISFSSSAGEGLVGGEGSSEGDVEEDDDIVEGDDALWDSSNLSLPSLKPICA